MELHSIQGGWLGTYCYLPSEQMEPVRFEAHFDSIEIGNFRGTVIDDGPLGEASVVGRQNGDQIAFMKTYIRSHPDYLTAPIEYAGTMSEDGKYLSGTWALRWREFGLIPRLRNGSWEARRMWMEEAEELEQAESEAVRVPILR